MMQQEQIELCYNEMSEQRKKYVNKFVLSKDRANGIIAYDLLKRGLAQEKGILTNPVFRFNQHGKPYLRDYPEIHFNLSHCSRAVACVISDNFVGVDIETIKPIDNSVIDYTCSEEEKEKILSSACPEIEFYKIWTMKESYLKMLGLGIDNNIKEVLGQKTLEKSSHTIIVNERKQYVCCCCEMKKYFV